MNQPVRRSRLALALIAALALAPGLSARAESLESSSPGIEANSNDQWWGQRRRHRRRPGGRIFGGHAAPEIDAGLLAGGTALLAGGTLVLLGQRRKRRQPVAQ